MLIYIPTFAGLLGIFVLALVWFADLYEREPIQRIQNWFLLGFLTQLILILTARAVVDLNL